jgi:hypothetical protein
MSDREFQLEIVSFDSQLAEHEEKLIDESEYQPNGEEEEEQLEVEGEEESFANTDPPEIDETDVVILGIPAVTPSLHISPIGRE